MDYATFRTELKEHLNRRDCTDSRADSFVDKAFLRINRVLDHNVREAFFIYTVAENNGESAIPLPLDAGKKIIEVSVDNVPVEVYPDRLGKQNVYLGYTRRGSGILFNQTLPLGTQVTIVYWRNFGRPPILTETNDLLKQMNPLVLYAALAEAGMFFAHDRTGEWSGTFDRLLLEAISEYQDRELSGYGGSMVVQAPTAGSTDY